MTNNDALRSIRYILNISDQKTCDILKLGGHESPLEDMVSYLKNDEDSGFKKCPDLVMGHFLNGLVTYKRGPHPSNAPQPLDLPIDNNVILKKLKVAFQLTDESIVDRLEKEGFLFRKSEVNALFRKKGHPNFRECGDQLLRYLLKSLAKD